MIDFVKKNIFNLKKSNLIIFFLTIAFFIFFFFNANNIYKLPKETFKVNLKFDLYDYPNEKLINIIEVINNEIISSSRTNPSSISQTYKYIDLQNYFIIAVDKIIKSPYLNDLAKVKYIELKKQLNQNITDLDKRFRIQYWFFDSLGYTISKDNLFGNKFTLDIEFLSLNEEKDNILSNYLVEIINEQLGNFITTEANNISHKILFNYRINFMYEKLLKNSMGLDENIDISKSYIDIEDQSKKLDSLLLKFKQSAKNQFYLDLNNNGKIVRYANDDSTIFKGTLKLFYAIFSTLVVFLFMSFLSFFIKFILKK